MCVMEGTRCLGLAEVRECEWMDWGVWVGGERL